jgi:LCP family protein required for cell wall assembly
VEDGRDRAPRRGGTDVHRESVEDILARHGLADGSGAQPAGGRAARRRAAEEQERAEQDAAPPAPQAMPPPGRHSHHAAPDPGPRRGGHALETGAAPVHGGAPDVAPGRHGTRGGPPAGRPDAPAPGTGGRRRAPEEGRPGSGSAPWPRTEPTRPAPDGGWPGPDRTGAARPGAPGARGGPAAPGWNDQPPAGARPGPAPFPGAPGPGRRPAPGPVGRPPADHAPADPTAVFGAVDDGPRPGRSPAGAGWTDHPSFPPNAGAPHGRPPAPTDHPSFPPHGAPAPRPAGPRVPAPSRSPLSPPHGGPPVAPGRPIPDGTTALPGRRPPAIANAAAATTAVPTAYRGPVDNAGAATTALPTRAPRPRPAERPGPEDATALVPPVEAAQPADMTTAVRSGGADMTTAVRAGGADMTAVVRPAEAKAGPRVAEDAPADPDETKMTRRQAEMGSRAEAVSRIDESLVRMTAAHAGLDLSRSDEEPEEAPPPVPRGRRLGRFAIRLVATSLTLLVLLAAGLGYGTKRWLDSGIRDAGAIDLTSSAIVDGAAQKGDQNVLVVASDRTRDPATRADTVAVAHIPAGGGPVVVLALPHNLQINRPSCDTWDPAAATYSDQARPGQADTQLVTAVDEGGPRCVTKVVQQLTGLAITQYVGLDLGGVEALSGALQGVDVCVPMPVVDSTLGTIAGDAGTNRLDGVRAQDFVRARTVQGDPASELGRIDRQQKLLAAALDRTLDERSLLNIGEVTALRPALRDALVLDGTDLDQTLALSAALHKLDAPGVVFAAAPTTGGTDGVGNAVLRDTDAAAVFAALREDHALPAQADDPSAATAGPDPALLHVQVRNASGKPGRAEQVSGTLGSLGFGLGEVGNAEIATGDTIIKFSPDQAAGAALLATSVPSATSVPDPGSSGVLQLVLGRSFDDVIQPPATPAADSTTPAPVGPRATCP